ncbi:MAG TPA: hypothetical protein VMN36_10355 [Verrucomicrobiales bacterium]|nr:hypothetical protein [Verrucomicrobiales bacterium]
MSAKAIPDGYHSVTPYLIVDNGAAALDFYRAAFGAVETMRFDAPGGKIFALEKTAFDGRVRPLGRMGLA